MARCSSTFPTLLSTPNSGDESIKRRLLRKGVVPTPKILHTLRKKHAQKSLRRAKKQALQSPQRPPLDDDEDTLFRTVAAEFRAFNDELDRRKATSLALHGKPWEWAKKGADLKSVVGFEDLNGEKLVELKDMLAVRNRERFSWLLDDDVEEREEAGEEQVWRPKAKKIVGDDEKIRLLVDRMKNENLSSDDWKFSWLLKQSGLLFTEVHMLRIVDKLGALGNWRKAVAVVEWVYSQKENRHRRSRFVYTKLLAVLGRRRRPSEALHVFKKMRGDGQLYPDIAAYHSIAVTLGQAGFLNELISLMECMKQKPSKTVRSDKHKSWDPCLEPDLIIYNAVLNACIPTSQWKGVFWVLQQIKHSGLKPNGATYGLAMEVMLRAGKYDLVHKFFEKMQSCGFPPKASTYRVLVKAFWKEGKIDEAIEAVRVMEQRGIAGTASVYYELACFLSNKRRWEDALVEIEKLTSLPLTRPLVVAYTGVILASLDGGHVAECISIFKHMSKHCTPNTGTINAMLKVYASSDMFTKAKEMFEAMKSTSGLQPNINGDSLLHPDAYTYSTMLELSASAQQWEYFEHIYKDMLLSGYQLNQLKHSHLLVEASRAGKGHLLEHTFDSILDRDEIPHACLFTAMICQTIDQQHFERTVRLLNGMAHASIKYSDTQWRHLLQRDVDSKDKLQNLLSNLECCHLVMEDPVPAFVKSVQLLCGTPTSEKISESSSAVTMDNAISLVSDAENGNGEKNSYVEPGEPTVNFPTPGLEDLMDSIDCPDTEQEGSINSILAETVVSSLPDSTETETFDFNMLLDSDISVTDRTLNMLTAHIGTPLSELPSASEILEKWRRVRINDGSSR